MLIYLCLVNLKKLFANFRWEKYDPIGKTINNLRLFAFKTPLSTQLQKNSKRISRKEYSFSTSDLLYKIAESGRSLGMVINVTNTARYYDPNDFEGMFIEYKHIRCPGRGFLNRKDLVKSFFKIVDEFLMNNSDNDFLIGIHCTNGVNRAGYLICRYLIDRLGWSSHQAIEQFEFARGCSIERTSYIQALHRADRERRLKNRRVPTIESTELLSENEGEEIEPKKRKRKKEEIQDEAIDPKLAAQMMQQFFQMEEQLKKAAENVADGYLDPFSNSGVLPKPQTTHLTQSVSYNTASPLAINLSAGSSINNSPYIGNTIPNLNQGEIHEKRDNNTQEEYMEDEEDDDEDDENESTPIDFETMGKIEVKKKTTSQVRRARRKKKDKQFQVMKRGKFWEINEMRKDLGL